MPFPNHEPARTAGVAAGVVDLDAVAGTDALLATERQAIGISGFGDMSPRYLERRRAAMPGVAIGESAGLFMRALLIYQTLK